MSLDFIGLGIYIGYLFLILGVASIIALFLSVCWAMFMTNYDRTFDD